MFSDHLVFYMIVAMYGCLGIISAVLIFLIIGIHAFSSFRKKKTKLRIVK